MIEALDTADMHLRLVYTTAITRRSYIDHIAHAVKFLRQSLHVKIDTTYKNLDQSHRVKAVDYDHTGKGNV